MSNEHQNGLALARQMDSILSREGETGAEAMVDEVSIHSSKGEKQAK